MRAVDLKEKGGGKEGREEVRGKRMRSWDGMGELWGRWRDGFGDGELIGQGGGGGEQAPGCCGECR